MSVETLGPITVLTPPAITKSALEGGLIRRVEIGDDGLSVTPLCIEDDEVTIDGKANSIPFEGPVVVAVNSVATEDSPDAVGWVVATPPFEKMGADRVSQLVDSDLTAQLGEFLGQYGSPEVAWYPHTQQFLQALAYTLRLRASAERSEGAPAMRDNEWLVVVTERYANLMPQLPRHRTWVWADPVRTGEQAYLFALGKEGLATPPEFLPENQGILKSYLDRASADEEARKEVIRELKRQYAEGNVVFGLNRVLKVLDREHGPFISWDLFLGRVPLAWTLQEGEKAQLPPWGKRILDALTGNPSVLYLYRGRLGGDIRDTYVISEGRFLRDTNHVLLVPTISWKKRGDLHPVVPPPVPVRADSGLPLLGTVLPWDISKQLPPV